MAAVHIAADDDDQYAVGCVSSRSVGHPENAEDMPFRLICRAMTKRVDRPRPRKMIASPVVVQPLSQFHVWKLGGIATNGKSSAGEPSDEDLLTAKPHPDSFRTVIAHLLAIGHLIGILPAPSSDTSVPKFRWRSFSVCFSVAVMTVTAGRIAVYVYCIYLGYMSAFKTIVSTRVGFHVLATLEVVAYLRLAARWRVFVLCFLRVERRQGPILNVDFHPSRLRRQMTLITTIFFILAVVEIVLQQTTFPLSRNLDEFNSVGEVFEDHYYSLFNHVAHALPYSPLVLLLAEFTTAATNLILNFNDVFLIVVSVIIVRRFRVLRARLVEAALQKQDPTYWKCARETFNELSQLTRDVDYHVSAQVLLSCLNNFFSICIQLQHTVKPASPSNGMVRKMYYSLSFGFVLLRSAAVVLSASSVPEESGALKRALYSVPSGQYGEEIQRFLAQVTTDDVTLTGLGLFSLTRSFVLTMLGTIATYEILLVQTYMNSS